MEDKIDFVVTWVDGRDKEWQKSKEETYKKINNKELVDVRKNRYRDMDCLKYWFRAIEKNAPWVNKIYFITANQRPKWLNTDNEKLVCVNHKDYMPESCLPTFNSNAIEANMHKIKGLSEKFVYFNDDMFIINKVNETDFFRHNLPCDTMAFHPIDPKWNDNKFYVKICNDIEIINKNFDFKKFTKENIGKCISIKQGKRVFGTLLFCTFNSFRGFRDFHMPISYLKSTFEEVWNKEPEVLEKTMSFRFRNNIESVNHWLYQYWQFASGNFHQRKASIGKYIEIEDEDITKTILGKKYKLVCINDGKNITDEEFEKSKKELIMLFEKKFPEKSTFEK